LRETRLGSRNVVMAEISTYDFGATYPGNRVSDIIALNTTNNVIVTL